MLEGIWSQPNESGFEYKLYPLEVKADDYQRITTDSTHVCQPIIRRTASSSFILPYPTSLRFVRRSLASHTPLSSSSDRFIRLVGKDHVIVVIEDEISLKLFFDPVDTVAANISNDRFKKRFHFEKVGRKHMFAVDETKRLLALVASHSVGRYSFAL